MTLPSPGAERSLANNKDLIVDTTPPTISSTDPAHNATAVAVGSDIVINFQKLLILKMDISSLRKNLIIQL